MTKDYETQKTEHWSVTANCFDALRESRSDGELIQALSYAVSEERNFLTAEIERLREDTSDALKIMQHEVANATKLEIELTNKDRVMEILACEDLQCDRCPIKPLNECVTGQNSAIPQICIQKRIARASRWVEEESARMAESQVAQEGDAV